MRIVKFLLSLFITLGLIYALSIRISVKTPKGKTKIPPLGKFLNPSYGFWQNAEGEQPNFTKKVKASSLKAGAKVYFDDRLVPHIEAQNLEDAYFLQGYVTAELRLWQMDFQSRAGAGRISEIVGASALEYDMKQRRKGMVFAAENALKKWKTLDGYQYVEAYTNGINAYIKQLSAKNYPVEFKLLNYKPELWSPLKTAIFMKTMSQTLSSHDKDLESLNALKMMDRKMFDYLFPARSATDDPIIPADTKWDFEPKPLRPATVDDAQNISYIPYESPPEGIGSNNWAMSGSRTLSGNPILSGDPHLRLTLPSIWMEIQIKTPSTNVYGVSLPGIQGVVIGFNENIAWSQTNVGRDILDWYTIDWKDNKKEEYKYGDTYRKATMKVEKYQVRDSSVIYDTVRYTHYGPVAYLAKNANEKDMAMQWMAHKTPIVNELMVFPMLNKATNYEEYQKALMNYAGPAQNFVFAARDGDVALWAPGTFPLKAPEQGRFVMEGSNPDNEWHGTIPHEHSPFTYNPTRGFVASANQETTAPNYPYYYQGSFPTYRGRYLNRTLRTMDSVTIKDMMNLQQDVHSLLAEEALPVMLENLNTDHLSTEGKKYLKDIKYWNYRYDRDSIHGAIFDEWLGELKHLVWDEFKGQNKPMLSPRVRRMIEIMKEDPTFSYFDIAHTKDTIETLPDLVTKAFHEATLILQGMRNDQRQDVKWGNYKTTKISHLARIEQFSINTFVGGSRNALNANSERNGPSWRMVVDMGKEVKGYASYPGGQSGNPGSRFYDNFINYWAEGEYYELFFMKKGDEKSDKIMFVQEFSK